MWTYTVKQHPDKITFKLGRRLTARIVKYRSGYDVECAFTRTGCMSAHYEPHEWTRMIENTLCFCESPSGNTEFIGLETIHPF